MKMLALFSCIGLSAILSAPASAASPWDGTWKLDQSKSHMTGDTFSETAAANGMIHFSNGSTIQYNYRCDSKPYSTLADYTLACTQVSARVRVLKSMERGTSTDMTRVTLSPDGKTQTDLGTGTQPDGTHYSSTTVYRRVSGSGWYGTWRDVKASTNVAALISFAVSGKHVTLGFPGYKQQAKVAIDGAPAHLTGPRLPPGVMLLLKSHGHGALEQQIVWHGKIYNEDIYSISPDGKTLTDVSWTPGKENEKQTYVYDKI